MTQIYYARISDALDYKMEVIKELSKTCILVRHTQKGEKYFTFSDPAGNCHFRFEWAMYWRCHKTSADELAEKSWRGL